MKGKGLYDEINNLTNEMHLYHPTGEYVPGGSFNNLYTYSYAGSGTKFVKRVREGYKGVNELDRAAMLHDLYYYIYKDIPNRNKAMLYWLMIAVRYYLNIMAQRKSILMILSYCSGILGQ